MLRLMCRDGNRGYVRAVMLSLPSDWSSPEQKRRGGRRDQMSRRMVALYDYDPRESSPNVDVEVGGAAHLHPSFRPEGHMKVVCVSDRLS